MKSFWNTKKTGPRSTPAFRAIFTRDRILMLHSILDFPENTPYLLKKVQEPVQHFSEQCRHYVPK